MNARKVLGLCACLLLAPSARADDLKKMEGVWLPLAAQMGAQKFAPDTLQTLSMEVRENRYRVKMGGVVDEGTLVVDAGKKPRAMDIVGTAGPNQGKAFLAIYELSGDYLRVCYSLEGKVRPEGFDPPPESKIFLVIYKRVRK